MTRLPLLPVRRHGTCSRTAGCGERPRAGPQPIARVSAHRHRQVVFEPDLVIRESSIRARGRLVVNTAGGPRSRAPTMWASPPRPKELLQARDQRRQDKIPAAEALRTVEDEAIRDAVQMQEEVGLQAATDGEFRRGSWHMDFIYQLDGISKTSDGLKVQFRNERERSSSTRRRSESMGSVGLSTDDLRRRLRGAQLVRHDGDAEADHSLAEHGALPRRPVVDRRGSTPTWTSSGAISRPHIARRSAGSASSAAPTCSWTTPASPISTTRSSASSSQASAATPSTSTEYIRHVNEALADRPPGMAVTTHTCRGNFRSSWVAEGGYDFVAEPLFSELQVDGFFLEYDDERSGGFEPLRFVPKEKLVVLGLVTTKRGELETKDELKRRIDEASRFIDLEQLCLSPQCGFSSTVEGNAVSYDEEVAKLRLVVETARDVWG